MRENSAQWRRTTDYTLLLGVLAVGGFAEWELRNASPATATGPVYWVLLVGAALAGGGALRRMDAWLPEAQAPARPVSCPGRLRRYGGQALVFLSSAAAAGTATMLWRAPHAWHGPLALWVSALGLMVAAGALLGCLGDPAGDENRPAERTAGAGAVSTPSAWPRWAEVLAFTSIAILAVFLRVYRIDSIPPGIFGDETEGGMDALSVIENPAISPFAAGWSQIPNGYVYYMAGLVKLLGANWAMLKTASLIPAVLTVLALYPLGRLLFGPTGGLCAMFFLAVSRWHLTMSRWGWIEVCPPLFQVAATFFLIRGLRERRAVDFALGGLLTGLMMYTYLSARLALGTLMIVSLYWVAFDPQGPVAGLRRHWRGIGLFFLAWAIAFAPLGVTYVSDSATFLYRVNQLNIFTEVKQTGSLVPLRDSVIGHLKAFHQAGDFNPRHNLPGEPQADPITGLLFVIGLAYGLLHLKDRRRGLLWLWVLGGMAGGIFSTSREAPHAFRSLTAVPAVALLAGDVLGRAGRGARQLLALGDRPRRAWGRLVPTLVGSAIVICGLLMSAVWESTIYFGRQADSVSVKSGFHLGPTRAAQDVIFALNAGHRVYLAFPFDAYAITRFLVYGALRDKLGRNTMIHPPYETLRPELDLPVVDPGTDALFIMPSQFWPLRDYILAFYPHADVELVQGDTSPPVWHVRARVSKQDLAAAQGLTARFTHADGRTTETAALAIDEDWQARDIVAADWSGSLRLPRSGTYTFRSDGGLMVSVDGLPWTDGTRMLGGGLHTLHVRQTECQARQIARLKWIPPGEPEATIPASAFFRTRPPDQGLTGYYYANQTWEGTPLFKQISPFFVLRWRSNEPFPAPFSVRFVGALRITSPGNYWLRIAADDGARLLVDGKVIGEGLVPYEANAFEAGVDLTPGDHAIEIDYFQTGGSSGLEFYWRAPGGDAEIVPPAVLIPETTPTSPQ